MLYQHKYLKKRIVPKKEKKKKKAPEGCEPKTLVSDIFTYTARNQ